jgi:hypothetical protein
MFADSFYGGLEIGNLALAGLDLKHEILGGVLAPLRELLIDLLGILIFLDDLGFQISNHLDDLLNGVGLLGLGQTGKSHNICGRLHCHYQRDRDGERTAGWQQHP